MSILSHNDFVFEVRRCQPELLAPAKPTPYEFKQLSDIDDQESLRFQVPGIYFYRHNPSMEGKDPVKVIKKAVAETLVFYYPLAGRLREGPGRKLFVECTGEGILFIEADTDVTLEQFDDALQPPFAFLEDVLYNVPNSDGIVDCPLLLIQVTRLKCGGFIFAIRVNHTMADAFGITQFLTAVGEIARGASTPCVLPVWQRALLNARDPPRVTCRHPEYDQVIDTKGTIVPLSDMVHHSIYFGPTEISTIRKTLPMHLRHCSSSFDLITAWLWRTRTIALQPDPNEEMRLLCAVNLRSKSNSLPLGYYGNAFCLPAAVSTAGKLCQNPLGYAVELVRKAKNEMTEEYMKSVADLMVINGRPNLTAVRYEVSDLTKAKIKKVDLGWGNAIFGGPADGGAGSIPSLSSDYVPFKNKNGEDGVVVPLSLPAPAMERFVLQLDAFFKTQPSHEEGENSKPFHLLSNGKLI